MPPTPATQYATDANLLARQRLWATSAREPDLRLHPWVVALADVRAGMRVAEVGCGNGEYLARLEALGARPVGVDLSPGMLSAARGRSMAPLVCGDAERLPLADDCLDVVLTPHVLYHVEDRCAAVRELRRVLRAGGTCVAVTNGEANHRQLTDLVADVVGHGWRWRRPSDHEFSLENGASQLGAGFGVVERVDFPRVTVSVTDADALADYVASVGDHHGTEVRRWTTWGDVVAGCRRRAAEVIDTEGAFTISVEMGAFVCR